MKNICLAIFLFFAVQSFSQFEKNSLKLGFLTGGTSHLGASGLGYHAQYDYHIFDRYSASISFGQLHGNATRQGRSRGNAGGISWDNSYELQSTEGYNYAEITGLYSYTERWRKIDLKVGGGVTFLSNWLNYDKDVDVVQGIVVSGEKSRRRDNVSMVNLVLDNDFKLTDQLFINWKLIFRKAINDQEPLEIVTTYGGTGTGTSTSEVDILGAMVVGLGYRF